MESQLILFLQRTLSSDTGRALIGFCARWLIYFYIPFAIVARQSKDMRHAVYEASWTAALAFSMSTIVAAVVARARPYLAIPGVEAIVPPNIQAGSFPSSHTAVAIGIAMALAFANVPIGVAAFIMALLVAFGRIAAGMHFPTDIIGGVAVGALAFIIVRIVHAGLERLGA
jgi:undecaprenyl-diphosphatase